MRSFQLSTRRRDEFVDITSQVRQLVVESGVTRGVCLIACPHTTAGITVQEGYDPDVARDMLAALSRLFPREGDYQHAEGNSDAHLKSACVGSSQMLPIENNALQLGRWQAVFFCEFDGPRQRTVRVQILTAS
jgi:secondary thiamine-phosphate synthase enzyme